MKPENVIKLTKSRETLRLNLNMFEVQVRQNNLLIEHGEGSLKEKQRMKRENDRLAPVIEDLEEGLRILKQYH